MAQRVLVPGHHPPQRDPVVDALQQLPHFIRQTRLRRECEGFLHAGRLQLHAPCGIGSQAVLDIGPQHVRIPSGEEGVGFEETERFFSVCEGVSSQLIT